MYFIVRSGHPLAHTQINAGHALVDALMRYPSLECRKVEGRLDWLCLVRSFHESHVRSCATFRWAACSLHSSSFSISFSQ
jgi:hypothetical protein